MPYKMQPAHLQEKWLAYCRQCDNHTEQQRYRNELVDIKKPVIYSMEGFYLFAGITETELDKYEGNKNYKTLLKNIRFAVLCRKLHALVNGEGSTTGLVFDLKANYGLHVSKTGKYDDWKITLNLDNIDQSVVVKGGKPVGNKFEKVTAEHPVTSLAESRTVNEPALAAQEAARAIVQQASMPTGRYCVF